MVAIIIAGASGAMIGYAFVDIQCRGDCTTWRGLGLIIGALVAAGGVAVVAVLTLRAMDEWRTTTDAARDKLDAPRGDAA